MMARRPREPELNVELVSVEVSDADARLLHAYRLVLKADRRVRMSSKTKDTKRIEEEKRTKPE